MDVAANLFRGELVQLVSVEPGIEAEAFVRWQRDTEYHRLVDNDPYKPRSLKHMRELYEKWDESGNPYGMKFLIRTLHGDRMIGFVGLFNIQWNHSTSMLGIGLGERRYWDNGYGTDAMRTILNYAFTELNLYRIALTVFSYNPRAIRVYEKCGFRQEGVLRQSIQREAQRWDVHVMGILQPEWLMQTGEVYFNAVNSTLDPAGAIT